MERERERIRCELHRKVRGEKIRALGVSAERIKPNVERKGAGGGVVG